MSAFALLIPLQHALQHTFNGLQNVSLPNTINRIAAAASVYYLAPLHLPRRPTRLVSYYAFFK